MHFPQATNSDISVLIVCNKTGGTIKGDMRKKIIYNYTNDARTHERQEIQNVVSQMKRAQFLAFENIQKLTDEYR